MSDLIIILNIMIMMMMMMIFPIIIAVATDPFELEDPISVCNQANFSNMSEPSCSEISGVNATSKCDFALNFCDDLTDTTLFNPIQFTYCTMPTGAGSFVVAMLVQVALLVLWFYLLGSTAEDFFCPTLEELTDNTLHMSPNVAGVTFLAFGNGAPDVFSNIAAFSAPGGGAADLGLAGLLGAGIFVTMGVVGAVTLSSKPDVSAGSFLRDSLFYLVAVITLFVFYSDGCISVFEAMTFPVFYFFYVAMVVTFQCACTKQLLSRVVCCCDKKLDQSSETELLSNSTPLMHGQCSEQRIRKNTMAEVFDFDDEGSFMRETAMIKRSSWLTSSRKLNFKIRRTNTSRSMDFMQLSQMVKDVPVAEASDAEPANSPKASSPRRHSFTASSLSSHPKLDLSVPFDSASIETNNQQIKRSITSVDKSFTNSKYEMTSLSAGEALDPLDGLSPDAAAAIQKAKDRAQTRGRALAQKTGGQSQKTYGKAIEEEDEDEDEDLPEPVNFKEHVSRQRKKFLARIVKWKNMRPHTKILFVVTYPLMLARRLTIPGVTEESWSREEAALSMIFAPVFASMVFDVGSGGPGFIRLGGVVPLWIILGVLGAIASVPCYIFSKWNHPPKWNVILIIIAFVMSIIWIMFIANELVNLLQSLGIIMNIPSTVLGLTVLAWGNSLGDMVANVSVARAGKPRMAIAGCYAGPMFNMLIGQGISLCIVTFRKLAEGCGTYSINPSSSHDWVTPICFYVLLTSLIVGIISVSITKFTFTRVTAGLLLSIYALFMILCVVGNVWSSFKDVLTQIFDISSNTQCSS